MSKFLKNFELVFQFVVPLVFVLNIILVLPVFFPSLSEMSQFDEAFYINNGRELTEGNLPIYAHNPFVAFFYTLLYIPLQASPFWLIHCCRISRFILFGLLWLNSYLIAKRISHLSHPLIMIIVILVSPALPAVITNGSDALFTVISGFCFWKILSFYFTKKISHLWTASVFVALAALSRNEGLILFLIFIPFCILLSISTKRIGICLAAWVAPFIAIVGGYVIFYGLSTGNFELGIAKRAYFNFEQNYGQENRYLPGRASYLEAQFEARRVFGTPEENNYSVITAIRRNRSVYFKRVVEVVKKLPKVIVSRYGGWLGVVFFLLALRGIIEIFKKKLYLLLCILLLWPSYLFMHLLFSFRTNHFLSPYFIVFLFTSVGISSILFKVDDRRESFFWFLIFLGLAFLGVVSNLSKSLLFTAPLVFLLGLSSAWVVIRKYKNISILKPIGLIFVFCTALLSKINTYYPYSFRKFLTIGIASDEKAAMFMREHLEPGARVGTIEPRCVFMAKMTYVPLYLKLRHITSNQELSSWIADQDLKAILVNEDFRISEPSLCALIEQQIDKNLKVGFTSEDGNIQVLLVTADH